MPEASEPRRWSLALYVSGASPRSIEAIENVRQICDVELAGRVQLEVIDVQAQPALVLRDHILAAPTLVRKLPSPLRKLVGDLSDTRRVRLALDLDPDAPTDVSD